jgi:golgin subfamily B member 1
VELLRELDSRCKGTMSANTIRNALGILQDDPDSEHAWRELREALGFTSGEGAVDPGDLGAGELAELLEAARRAHEKRQEHEAVAGLLEIEAAVASGEREAELVAELSRVRDDLLLDERGAVTAYERLLSLRPGDPTATEALERSSARRGKWKDLAQRYFQEAKGAGDAAFKSSLLASAAEIAFRYGGIDLTSRSQPPPPPPEEPPPTSARGKKGKKAKAATKDPAEQRRELLERTILLLRDALSLDPKNRRAALLHERILRDEGRWEELAAALDVYAGEVTAKEEKVAALVRLARVRSKKLDQKERAVEAYERVLDLAPGHAEATSALVDHFTERGMWEHLVALYDGQLAGGGVPAGQESGIIFQIAMVHWRMRERPEAAEPYFERLRRLEPSHQGMLGFFRELCRARGEQPRLLQILSDAQRSLPDGAARAALGAEIAQLAEEGANAQKAIEQWRAVLRSDPSNIAARDALKRLYRHTGGFNHLADLLRADLEGMPESSPARLPVLREIAQIYRESIKSDSALVTVLSQIISLEPTDAGAVRELSRVYESLGRWRDLLTTQTRLAELEPEADVRAELYRAVARRWLDQFSNVQNAVEAYEKLREASPEDAEALEKLKELYTKRRSYRQLYDLHEAEAARTSGEERRLLWLEMAKLAAERLDRGADAARLYKQVLEEDPTDLGALDALERQAEREKDYATVAEALERRVELTEDVTARVAVLQKLGALQAERLQDPAGALRSWGRVLDLSPGHGKALRVLRDSYLAMGDYDGLTELYARTSDWEGLVEVLSTAADRATAAEAKVDLSYRCASIFEKKLGAPERAFRAYERILSARPDDHRAAAALVPLYENEEKWARLPALYELLLANTTDPAERLRFYRRLADVSGQRLADKAAAFRYACKAFELADDPAAAAAELEGWARASGDWAGFAEALEARLASAGLEPAAQRSLQLKLAEVSASHTGRPDHAIAAYRALLDANPDDDAAIRALDHLLRANPDRQADLRWLFRHRAERADAEARIAILVEWAMLEEEAFGSPEGAVTLLREILELEPAHARSLRALGRLLLAAGDSAGAAAVLEKERDLEEGPGRVARELELARLYVGPLRQPLEALSAARRALELAPSDPAIIAFFEELLPIAETRAQAAIVLEEAYAQTGAWQKQIDVLMVLIATAASKADRLSLYTRLADVKEKLGDRAGAFDVVSRAAAEYPAELDLWDRLSVLANRTHRTQQFVDAIAAAVPEGGETGLPEHVEMDLAERAATLYDEMLGDIDRAVPYLERILSRDPANERAFLRLKQILTTREKWSELEALYERVLSATPDPARRVDLLAEVAIVSEEITGDRNRAIRHYERILELEPAHEQAMFSLDKLYAAEERWQNLADLLQRRLSLAGDIDTTSLRLRLGTLLWNRLGDPKAALNYLEEVVVSDSAIREARELVEKCLTHPNLRQRAAIILEGVYAEREEMRDLVRVLEIRLEFVTSDVERRELLRRIAELRDERLTDDRGAFETYGRLLPLSPGDVEARLRYVEIARRLERLSEAAGVVLVAASNAESPQPRAELLADAAKIYEETTEVDRAEEVRRQVLDLAPDDPTIALPAARALERIYSARGRSRELVDVLRVQLKLEDAADARRELLGRIARLCENDLKDDAAAIEAWRGRLHDDPGDGEALGALDRLYERTADHRALVEVLRTREQQAEDAGARKEFMLRTARALADRVADVDQAILAYRAVLDDFGADRDVLAALSGLYEKALQWRDLAETLEGELALAAEVGAPDPERIALLVRLGEVRRRRLGEVEEALEPYREALTLDPGTRTARTELEELLGDENVRLRAAAILRPLYETEGAHAELVRVLDIELEAETAPDARLALLARLADETERSLGDPVRASSYAARGLREAASDDALPTWLERVERLTATTGQHAELVQLYRDALPDVLDEDRKLELTLRIADLARTELADAALAKEHYRAALELRAGEPRALVALSELYEDAGEHQLLLEIYGVRAEVSTSDSEKRSFLYKQARLCDESLQDRERAIGFYEEILELGLDAAAVAALERLYAAAGRWGDLVALHERELVAGPAPRARRAELHHALGRIYERELAEIERAFDEYAEALREDPDHAPTLASLEQLMAGKTHAGRAAEMLEAVYLARLDFRKVMVAIEARLESSEDPDERRTLLRRLAKLHEEQEEDYKAALEVTAKLLSEDIADEATRGELERLARVANAEARLAEIYAGELDAIPGDEPATARLSVRTGELFEAQGNVDRALHFYRRAYQFSPEEEQVAFSAIDRLLARGSRPVERVALYRDALDYRTEPEARIKTLHAIAEIEEGDLGDAEAAIATYRAILDIDETETRALDTLARLFESRERFRDLAELYRRRAEQSALPEEEARWRLALARTLDEKLGEAAAALDELETVLGLAPGNTPSGRLAVSALEGMIEREEHRARVVELVRPVYEAADEWQKLIGLGRHRFVVATTPQEKVAVLRDTATLLEQRATDLDRAFACLKEAFVLDPDDGDTREELDRVAVSTSRWDDLADAYEQGIESIDGIGQRELLEALARLHDSRRDDPRKALEAWDRLFALDESDPRPLDEMDQLATLLSDWPTLVRVLAKRAELTSDDEERASIWRRIGEARRDMLDDGQGAIDAYERALELEPDSAFTLDTLIELYEGKSDAARLVDLYRRRVDLCGEDDGTLRRTLLLDAARSYEVGLQDRRAAVSMLDEALAAEPGDAEIMERLALLYEAEGMWPELLDNLRARAEAEADPAKKAALTKHAARLLASELDDHAQALETYREVLVAGYDDEAAHAVRDLGEQREELRREAAEALEPLLREQGKHELLVGVLELRLRAESEPHERAATRKQIASVCETSLGDVARAEASLHAALTDAPEDAELHAEIERLAALLGREAWQRYVDVLGERAASIFDAKVTADLFLRLGRVAETELQDLPRAAAAYARGAESGGDTAAVLTALERVYGALDDASALVDVLERRIAITAEPAEQAELYHRLASLQLGPIGDKAQGLATLRLALEALPEHEKSRDAVEQLLSDDALFDEAWGTLEGVYRTTGRGAELGRLYARRVERADTERTRTRARLELARVLEEEAGDPGGAQRAVEAALEGDLHDPEALVELERLAEKNDGWSGAADALARALESAEGAGGERAGASANGELWTRLARWRRDRVGDPQGAEVAFTRALAHDPENLELVRSLEELTRSPGRERDRVTVLRRIGRLEGEPSQKREVAREAVQIAEEVLGDPALAEEILREALAEDEADAWAAEQLTRLREAAGDHAEVVTLLIRRAEATSDGGEAIELRRRAADVSAERMSDPERACALYEEIVEQEPTDVRAQARLRELYGQLGKHQALAGLLTRLVDMAATPEERSALRLELARLQLATFEAPRDASETLRAILEEDPDHEAAATTLSEIYETQGDDAELAELWKARVERARDRGDAALELERRVRLGEILELRVNDPALALGTYEEVLEREPTHRGALEAVARLGEARGLWEKAAAALHTLSETASGPQATDLCLRLARARKEGGDVAGFQRALERALEADPTNRGVRTELAELHESLGHWAELAALLASDADLLAREHGAYVPPAPAPVKGGSLAPPGPSMAPPPAHVAEQVALLRRAADIHLGKRAAPDDAIPLLERAAELVPSDRELLLALCDAYSAAKRERDAAGVLERVIASFGNRRTKELSLYHHRLGRALASLGDKDVALAQLDMAFKIDPSSVLVLKDLGVLALESDDLERAQKTFRALLLQRLDSESGISKGEVFYYLGAISMKQGDKAKAVQMLERAVENEPSLDRAKAMLADLKG